MKSLQDCKIDVLDDKEVLKIEMMEKKIFSIPWSGNLLKQIRTNPNNIFLGIFFRDELIGYLIASVLLDETELLRLAILPAFRRCGLARRMLFYYFNIMKQCQKFYLEVRENNEMAKNLYLSLDYEVYYIRKNYYSDGTNALLMKRENNERH